MSQSLVRLIVHVAFSTKGRVPWLTPELRHELYPYMAKVLENIQCPAIKIGGTEDHVHVLCLISRTSTMAGIVEDVKTSTSRWAKTKGPGFSEFHWQNGYGAFSVSQSAVGRVEEYIAGQEGHHRKVSFQDEFRRFLKQHGVVYDERYVWD